MSQLPWSQNDRLFRQLVKEGHAWQLLPYVFLSLQGFDVEMPELTIRENISQAGAWLSTYDLLVNKRPIEVKSRPFPFTHPSNWPKSRAPAFLDTKKKWDAKKKKPFAYIFVSKATGGMVATCSVSSASNRWEEVIRRDRVRNITETFYAVPTKHLVTMDRFIDALQQT